jgi:hypothetical protein
MKLFDFVILCLAVYRFSSLFAWESGPFDILDKFRHGIGVRYNIDSRQYGTNMLSKMIICQLCNSVYLGVLASIMYLLFPALTIILAVPFALSAVTCVLVEKM